MASINDFIAGFKGGGARGNRFKIIITWPAIVGTPDVADSIVCHSAAMPSSLMGIVQMPYLGRMIPLIGDRTFEPWTATFQNDTSFSHRNAFERWMNAMNGHEGNLQATANYKDLLATINIYQLDRDPNETVLKSITLLNVWPSNLSQIDVAYDLNDSIEQFSVTFEYSHWTSVDSPTT